ncbi:MAG: hypothetical protein QM754_12070 [Tepidisphaeraceae bacterium]
MMNFRFGCPGSSRMVAFPITMAFAKRLDRNVEFIAQTRRRVQAKAERLTVACPRHNRAVRERSELPSATANGGAISAQRALTS